MRRRPGWSARGGRDEAVHFRYDDGPLDGRGGVREGVTFLTLTYR